jgi:hypothetical protein
MLSQGLRQGVKEGRFVGHLWSFGVDFHMEVTLGVAV